MKLKGIVSIILCICLLLTSASFVVSANASESYAEASLTINTQNKISAELVEIILSGEKDVIPVYIFLKDCVSTKEIEDYVLENYDNVVMDSEEFIMYYRQELAKIIGEYVQGFIDKNEGLFEDIIFQSNLANFIIAKVKPENIEKIAKLDVVNDIDYYSDFGIINDGDIGTDNLYEDKFLNKFEIYDEYQYNELYYYKNADGEIEWVLVNARGVIGSDAEISFNIKKPGLTFRESRFFICMFFYSPYVMS